MKLGMIRIFKTRNGKFAVEKVIKVGTPRRPGLITGVSDVEFFDTEDAAKKYTEKLRNK